MEIKEEIYSRFKLLQSCYLATCCDHQPYVRPMTLIYYNNNFYMTTDTSDNKIKQIQANPAIELCCIYEEKKGVAYTRAIGTSEIVTDKSVKHTLFKEVDFIKHFWDNPDHENFTVLQFNLKTISYTRAGEMTSHLINVGE